ncbi:myosin-like coiled-coil protein-domain-containing protein [Tirmania nivea]|nr:myosin-like coiled-coil protein-domain-containing protein [Tirmania nivea]
MSDVASQSRGGLRENCAHSKSTGTMHVEGPANGDQPAPESPSSNATPPPLPPPATNNSAAGNKKGSVTAKKKALDPTEVNNLLTAKISQLESDASLEEEEEKQIVRKANKDLAELVNSREDSFAKVEIIQQKYSDLLHDMKKLEREHTKARKRADQLQKEKEQSRAEMTKAVQLKAQNEKQKREELSNKFEDTMNDIKRRMEEETDSTSRKSTPEADELFKAKFKSFVEQYEMRELHFISLLRTKELEVQYNQARYEQQRKQAEAESSRAKALNSQVSTFSQTEAELRSQLNIYVEKFKQRIPSTIPTIFS